MRRLSKIAVIAFLLILVFSPCATAIVFINEVFINPPGISSEGDANLEFIELFGTPNKKLDGYAVAVFNGTQAKYYPLGSVILSLPSPSPEIDQFFSLDGLALGKNGLLVLIIRDPSLFYFNEILDDSDWVNWNTLWYSGLAAASQLDNNGSFTISIIRNRPGITEADPSNAEGLRWAKEIAHDAELFTPVEGPDETLMDQFGDGNFDRADPNGMGGNTIDMTGLETGGMSNDLEVIDEVSFEDQKGWEYDSDGRHVDFGSTFGGLPHRHVHAIDDPVNFNPDALTRVDYRTKGPGWAPSGGGTGEMANGNNWPDTATEQWIRGDTESGFIPEFPIAPVYFFENIADGDPNAVQPWETHVPLWLDDGNAPDYDFTTRRSYMLGPGRINPLAIPFIPGDTDRDGVCDQNDIDKLVAEFGEDDWIFSNSFYDAPEGDGDSNEPAIQTRPWDLDGTGENGIEASDLQWVLNFQGDTTGQIIGIRYDSTTPAAAGVYLNSNSGTVSTITTTVNIPSGRPLSGVIEDDIIEVIVNGQLTTGANVTSNQENGIMQFVHDIAISAGGIIEVTGVEALGSFTTTRDSLQAPQGSNGDLEIDLVNGYTTDFTQGLAAPAALYKITLKVVGTGSANVTISPAGMAKFAASTPQGAKIGHTNNNGNPASSVYPTALAVTAIPPTADFDSDGDVDGDDYAILANCWGTQLGDGDYNPLCDIGLPPDNKINFIDLEEFTSQWLIGT
ncbi:MAG: hypothetical protein FVQ80_00905 [Planctomycetes bacterium]|nr:hypothetical protein [Planctomycetota bacterium]